MVIEIMSYQNSPTAWSRFIARTHESNKVVPEELGGDFGQLARWSARFRLAKSFKALDLGDAYSGSDTPQLYSAITKIFLVYSAFETYCHIIGLNPSDESQVKLLQDAHSQEKVIQTIRDLDPDNAVSKSLVQHLNNHLKQVMYAFQKEQDINVSCFAKCIRHVFAHGILTANASGLSPKRFDQVSQVIADFLLNCMDQDFNKRIP